MNEEFEYIPSNSELNIYFTMASGEDRDVASIEYDEYIISKYRFKLDKENKSFRCKNLNEFFEILKDLFQNEFDDNNSVTKCIKNEIELYKLDISMIAQINIFIGSNDPSRGLKERESIDVDFIEQVLETSKWDEK